jgi:hypothetical protein
VAAGLASLAAAASPIYVRVDGDDVNCDGTIDAAYPGSGTGLSCAVRTVQEGINLVDPGGTVMVGTGVFAENVSISKDLTLMGADAGGTIIDGGGSSRVVYVNINVDLTISDVTIRNGGGFTGAGIYVTSGSVLTLTGSIMSNNTSCSGCSGAGLYLAHGASAVISNCSFVDNTTGASADGAGVFNWRNPLTVVGSTFSGNDSSGRGGAIFSGLAGSSLTVIDSTFSDNTVTGTGASGGAIWHDTGTLIVSNTTIFSNSASYAGGGIGLSGGTTSIYGSTIAENSATDPGGCFGGGVRNFNGTLTIEDSVVRDNRVSGGNSYGGGIVNDGRTTLNRATVSGNSSDYRSGGIHSQDPLTMTNVTISGNNASDAAGGLMQTGSSTGTLVNCTIASNTLSAVSPFGGGGLHAYSTVNMTNTLLAYNDNANCFIGGGSGSLNSYGHNLEDGDSCDLGATGDITGTDPLLGSLGYYGGPMVGSTGSQEPMRLQALRSNSPAIDAGDDAGCPSVDQRGVSRPVDGDKSGVATCDIGTYEFNLLNDAFLPVVLKSY